MKKTAIILASSALALYVYPVFAGGGPAGEGEQARSKCLCSGLSASGVGWCTQCGVGKAFGNEVKSQKLIAALKGEQMKVDAITCPSCKMAFASDGTCTHCNVNFNKGVAYHSPVAFALSKGEVIDPASVECPGCKEVLTKGKGKCCDLNVLSGLVYKDKDNFKNARKAQMILTKAIRAAEKCDGCAVAMVNDGTCEHCKISFKDGRKVGGS